MKRNFTFLIAAFALLAIFAIPMGMWGQTRTTQTASYGFETNDASWTATTFVTNNTAITAHGGSKYGATNGTTASLQYNAKVASPLSLTCYYSKTTTNTNAGSHFEIQVSSNNSTWTTVATGLGMDQVTKGTWYELTADLSSYPNVYVRVRYDGTTGVRALDDITLVYSDSGVAPAENYDVDFESATTAYDSWTFDNMTSYQTGDITAHGDTYYGTTGGKESASITTSSKVENPGTLTCYVSKQSNNTTASTWYIQVSSNGTSWTNVESRSASDMNKGEWKEFTANLSSYSNVYVRVYYSGSTAVRNIDDLTLTTVESSSAVATTTTINDPDNFNNDIYQGTTAGTLTATVSAEGTPISGATVTWTSSDTNVAAIDANGAVTLVAVGTTTITARYAGVEDEYRPSEGTYELTVTSSAPASTYTLASSIVSGKTYIIVGFNGDNAYAMAEQKENNRAGVAITVDGNTATGNAEVHEVVITALDGDDAGKYTIEDGGYLYASSSSANQLKTETTLNDNGKWTIVIVDGEATITAQGTNSRKLMRFNPNNGSPLFACYATNNTTGSLPRLYVKDETPAPQSYELSITGYGTGNGNWYLIASPVEGVTPTTENGFIQTGEGKAYDLYRFDQSQELEWLNYKVTPFNLISGHGYLYASKTNTQLKFAGTPYSGNGQVTLSYSTANSDPRMHGMNLVGNPFPEDAAYIDRDFYTVNPNSNEFMVVSRAIEPMEGAIVKTSGTQNETMTFSTTPPANNSKKLALNLSQGHGILDRAIVHFEESQPLTKLQMRDNSTSICIPMDGVDYASISADNQGEMPVSFKAEENGTYTLSFNAEDVELNYLHLFDNMTGNDVDLLANPSYTFEAKKTDYRSRFKLVFATGNNSNDDTFAFYSSGNWVITNEGEATLQVVDVTGRIVSSEAINGCANININAANGVYMLRLVNGNNVKTQKIVVK